MTNIKYQVTFFSQWHCGSGLSKGADVDALVIKDEDGLPFIPGRTMKGLVKEATEELLFLQNGWTEEKRDAFIQTFGNSEDRDYSHDNSDSLKARRGNAFFGNAELDENERAAIIGNKLQKMLYNQTASTAIGKDGIAEEHSLRQTETVVPCRLHGEISGVDERIADTVVGALRFIKRIGVNRTRGLGRCDIKGERRDS